MAPKWAQYILEACFSCLAIDNNNYLPLFTAPDVHSFANASTLLFSLAIANFAKLEHNKTWKWLKIYLTLYIFDLVDEKRIVESGRGRGIAFEREKLFKWLINLNHQFQRAPVKVSAFLILSLSLYPKLRHTTFLSSSPPSSLLFSRL